jgi:adenosylmethionine-8-amino-7-oxononanoate aminotransferase
MTPPRHLLNTDFPQPFPQAFRGAGIHLYDQAGRAHIDGCSGALVANIGHGQAAIARAMAAQAAELSYVYRYHFSSPAAESLAARYCALTAAPMGAAYFTNSGSEAVEAAVKLARVRHLAAGEPGRFKVISRHQSYHGVTLGALSWSGMPSRQEDYRPYLSGGCHIAPAYCYRCWFARRPETCALECAQALEAAVIAEGPATVAAFIAEPVVGAALGAAAPPAEYFAAVRRICDRHGVLFIAEEVMTGAGRTGGRFFASDHFPGRPDIIVFGKGVGGGYYPLAGALVSTAVAETIGAGRGGFAAGQSYSGHPVGMAAGGAILDFFQAHDLLARAAETGARLGRRLETLRAHPSVGDVRGRGMMWGLEFVADQARRTPFDPRLQYHRRVYAQARANGLLLLPSGGCDHGRAGDLALVAPPLVISETEVDTLVGILDETLTQVERECPADCG